MNYSGYRKYDTANGPGIRNTLFTSGCTHHCPGCFNKAAWDFNYGKLYTAETEEMIINDLKDTNRPVTGFSVLGGEPFDNAAELFMLLRRIKSECPDKNIWVWSGYTYDEIITDPIKNALLVFIDVLVDGRFVEVLKDPGLAYRGSRNQRIINVKLTKQFGSIIEKKML